MNTTVTSILDHLATLGDETRTRILTLLQQSEFTVSELCTVLQAPQGSGRVFGHPREGRRTKALPTKAVPTKALNTVRGA